MNDSDEQNAPDVLAEYPPSALGEMVIGAVAGAAGGFISGGAGIGMAAGLAGTGASTALGRLGQIVETGTARLRRGIQQELVEAAFTRLPRVEQRMRELEQAIGRPPTPTEVNVHAQYVSEAWANSPDPKKRELLLNALENAFDPELYREGLTR